MVSLKDAEKIQKLYRENGYTSMPISLILVNFETKPAETIAEVEWLIRHTRLQAAEMMEVANRAQMVLEDLNNGNAS